MADGSAIVYLGGVDADEMPRSRLDRASAAPRSVASCIDDSDSVLVVSMSGKGARARCLHRIYPGEGKSLKENLIHISLVTNCFT